MIFIGESLKEVSRTSLDVTRVHPRCRQGVICKSFSCANLFRKKNLYFSLINSFVVLIHMYLFRCGAGFG
ncbi:hypothetical protein EUGRSUZ_I01307 [Eucalyptus grandis]|uniref:Uncharacterized protein n=2 Tax=Eucalyptus grandis TaxID=71139 RepID=A0A059AN45_EUCGR|nr:hypothetical protein EUGRSUZ_I01307 [Eucalyptus grandis]